MQRNNWSPRLFLILALLVGVMAVGWVALSADEASPAGGTIPPPPTAVFPKPTQFAPLIFNQPLPSATPIDIERGGS